MPALRPRPQRHQPRSLPYVICNAFLILIRPETIHSVLSQSRLFSLTIRFSAPKTTSTKHIVYPTHLQASGSASAQLTQSLNLSVGNRDRTTMSSLISAVQDLISSILNVFRSILSTIFSIFENVTTLFTNLVSSVLDFASGLVGFLLGTFLPLLPMC